MLLAFRNALRSYENSFGGIELSPGSPAHQGQNHQLWTGIALMLLERKGYPISDRHAIAVGCLNACGPALGLPSGLYGRNNTWAATERQSIDNLLGILAMAKFGSLPAVPREILRYGAKSSCTFGEIVDNFIEEDKPKNSFLIKLLTFPFRGIKVSYVYNVTKPGAPSWFGWWGRSPGAIATLKLAAGEKLSILEALALAASQLIAYSKKFHMHDNWCLGYLTTQIIGRPAGLRYIPLNFINGRIINTLRNNFPDNTFGRHLRHNEPGHPLAEYWTW